MGHVTDRRREDNLYINWSPPEKVIETTAAQQSSKQVKEEDQVALCLLTTLLPMEPFPVAVNAVSPTEDPFSTPLTSIPAWYYKILAALMFLVTALSLCENLMVMLVTFQFKQLRQPLNYIIVNLSLADFLVSLTGGTISVVTNFRGYFFLGRWACVLEGFAVTYFGIVALWSLAVLAFERFFVIAGRWGTFALVLIMPRWLCCLSGVSHSSGPFRRCWAGAATPSAGSEPPVNPTACQAKLFILISAAQLKVLNVLSLPWYSGHLEDHSFIVTLFSTCFILPLAIIIVCYCKLIRKLRKVSISQGRLVGSRRPERQVSRMVVVMILAFLLAWTPYASLSIAFTVYPTMHLDPRLAAAPAFLAKTAAVYNPIIYVFMNKQFKKCLLQLLRCSDVTVVEGNNNHSSEHLGATNESNTGEMSAIAARVSGAPKTEENHHNASGSFKQIPIPENKVCPM
ncbi:hypothetical protein DNTS_029300 [Danionella cerebrum]|uniref:G-protein coupled receptors family 1 profile domain-containing protein n=1 Tax=Danionella cerebrum TaxID=2873325 RepID=A0A553QGF2_9TELE|nr:hypothetical protein DNTS_029300 [Danionella translucida]